MNGRCICSTTTGTDDTRQVVGISSRFDSIPWVVGSSRRRCDEHSPKPGKTPLSAGNLAAPLAQTPHCAAGPHPHPCIHAAAAPRPIDRGFEAVALHPPPTRTCTAAPAAARGPEAGAAVGGRFGARTHARMQGGSRHVSWTHV